MTPLHDMRYVAKALKLSEHTVRANPAKYHMYKIGGFWRISESDLQNYIDESRKRNNNVIRLALVNDNKEIKKCHYQREMASIISTSARQAANELDALLG
jgi:hypothetical protein